MKDQFSYKPNLLKIGLITSLVIGITGFPTSLTRANPNNPGMGKNNYIDLKTYSNEPKPIPQPAVVLSERSTGCERILAPNQATTNNCLPNLPPPAPIFPEAKYPPNQKTGPLLTYPLGIPGTISSSFGWRVNPWTGIGQVHEGTDIVVPIGTPVLAAASGKVTTAGNLGGYGLMVILRHQQETRESRYAHMSQILVQPGTWVEAGTIIGLSGNTGWSTGPHLHFEWRELVNKDWLVINPESYLINSRQELMAAQQKALQKPKPSLEPSQYRSAPRSVIINESSDNLLLAVIEIPEKITTVFRSHFFRLKNDLAEGNISLYPKHQDL